MKDKTLVVIDNYDSFTYNLVQLLRCIASPFCLTVRVVRNSISLDRVQEYEPCGIVLSPGPGGPRDGGVSLDVLRSLPEHVPVLGVCLGHQILAYFYNAKVQEGIKPVHGKTSQIEHNGGGLFKAVPNPFYVGRYHSLVVNRETLPDVLEEDAWTKTGELMGFHHRELPRFGVQFHPESFLSEYGSELITNFVRLL
jgi:anthranilate synthase/aminodeoxychorismate synthase-like glutamine amidotransferase